MDSLLERIFNKNLFAKYELERRIKFANKFVCRGNIQLSLAKDAIISTPSEICYIGLPLLSHSTPRTTTTVIACDSKSVLNLDGANIGKGVIITCGHSARLDIGVGSYITDGSRIATQQEISIGKKCAISFGVTIMDDDGHGFGDPPYSKPIYIEDNVWIGCNVTVLKGVRIGQGSVLAAGAVVTKSCPPQSLMAGVPAKVIKEGIVWTDAAKISRTF